jgi:hypothetical protein
VNTFNQTVSRRRRRDGIEVVWLRLYYLDGTVTVFSTIDYVPPGINGLWPVDGSEVGNALDDAFADPSAIEMTRASWSTDDTPRRTSDWRRLGAFNASERTEIEGLMRKLYEQGGGTQWPKRRENPLDFSAQQCNDLFLEAADEFARRHCSEQQLPGTQDNDTGPFPYAGQ